MKHLLTIALLVFSMSAAAEEKIVISDTSCKKILARQAAQSAEYKPGVDVHGNKVVAADLDDPTRIKMPEEITFDISPKIYELLGREAPKGLEDTAFTLGTVKVKKNGVVTFNGKRLNRKTRMAIIDLCREHMAKKK